MAELTDDQKKIKDLESQVATLTKTNAEQKANLDTLTKTNAGQQAQIDSFKTDLTNAQDTVKDLNIQLTAALAAQAAAETNQEQALSIVKELKAQLAQKEARGDKLPTLSIGKDSYELTSEFTFGGVAITHQLLTENPALAQQLVKEGVSNLRKVVSK